MSAQPDDQVCLRPMQEGDLEGVMAIEAKAYEFPWTLGIFRDCLRVGYNCWVYEQGGEVFAYTILSVAAGEAHVLNVCVDPDRQGEGWGRKLMRHLIDLAVRKGADTLLLEVRPSNKGAIALYLDLGFHEVGLRRAYYPARNGREDALILARPL